MSGSQNDFPASTCFAHGTRSRERGGRSVHAAPPHPLLSALTCSCIAQPGPFWRRVHRVGESPPPMLRSWSLRPAGWCGDPILVDTAFYAVSGWGAGQGLGKKASTWHECLLLSKRISVGAQHTDDLSSAHRRWHCQCYVPCGCPAGHVRTGSEQLSSRIVGSGGQAPSAAADTCREAGGGGCG